MGKWTNKLVLGNSLLPIHGKEQFLLPQHLFLSNTGSSTALHWACQTQSPTKKGCRVSTTPFPQPTIFPTHFTPSSHLQPTEHNYYYQQPDTHVFQSNSLFGETLYRFIQYHRHEFAFSTSTIEETQGNCSRAITRRN